ncbi:MAG: hypothetical protein WD273_08890 [Trueperaceae bacterium]
MEQQTDRPFHWTPGIFMALFLALSLILSLTNPALFASPNEPLLNGRWAVAYQEAFESESALFEPATHLWGAIEYTLFSQGRPGLLVGSNDWLFSREEFEFPAREDEATADLASNLTDVAAVQERLAEQGVQLVVVLLPAKARIYPEHLGRYTLPEGPSARYEQALTGLQELGVPIVNLLPALERAKDSRAVFLRTDTHWTPYGARIAAREVADEVSMLGPFPWLNETAFVTDRGEPAPYRGDLTQFLPLGPLYETIGPADDLLAPVDTELRATPTNNDLFAAVQLPVALVGTSYSEDDRWNFAGYLRQTLGSDILMAAEQGRGPYLPMLDYLEGEAYRSSPPELVVWEIPERYLSERWQTREESP